MLKISSALKEMLVNKVLALETAGVLSQKIIYSYSECGCSGGCSGGCDGECGECGGYGTARECSCGSSCNGDCTSGATN